MRASISLRARRAGGKPVRKADVLGPLGLEERVAAVTEDPPLSSARLELGYGEIDDALKKAAAWLMDQKPEAFELMRLTALQLDVEIVVHSDDERPALRLAPPFLIACARRELPVSIIVPR